MKLGGGEATSYRKGGEEVKEGKMLKKRRKREHIVKKYLILITDMFEGKKRKI